LNGPRLCSCHVTARNFPINHVSIRSVLVLAERVSGVVAGMPVVTAAIRPVSLKTPVGFATNLFGAGATIQWIAEHVETPINGSIRNDLSGVRAGYAIWEWHTFLPGQAQRRSRLLSNAVKRATIGRMR